jgi:hypothetical protein
LSQKGTRPNGAAEEYYGMQNARIYRSAEKIFRPFSIPQPRGREVQFPQGILG